MLIDYEQRSIKIENSDPQVLQELYARVVKIKDDYDSILGVITFAEHEEDRQTVVNYIDANQNASIADILCLVAILHHNRNNPDDQLACYSKLE